MARYLDSFAGEGDMSIEEMRLVYKRKMDREAWWWQWGRIVKALCWALGLIGIGVIAFIAADKWMP
jgi:hypothetical protein